jgi:hypothetical protein
MAAIAAAVLGGSAACSTTTGPEAQVHDDCPRSIAQYCAAGSGNASSACAADYATARRAAGVCNPNETNSHYFAESCGGFDVLTDTGDDTGTSFYYGVGDGKLVAVVATSANFGGSRSCVAANAARFTPPDCPLVMVPCDSTSDGGIIGDGGGGGGGGGGAADASSHD